MGQMNERRILISRRTVGVARRRADADGDQAGMAGCVRVHRPAAEGHLEGSAFTGPPLKQVLVIGAFRAMHRRVIEDAFTGDARCRRHRRRPSFGMLPRATALNERVRAPPADARRRVLWCVCCACGAMWCPPKWTVSAEEPAGLVRWCVPIVSGRSDGQVLHDRIDAVGVRTDKSDLFGHERDKCTGQRGRSPVSSRPQC